MASRAVVIAWKIGVAAAARALKIGVSVSGAARFGDRPGRMAVADMACSSGFFGELTNGSIGAAGSDEIRS
jgi:hypothetical protein